MSGGTDRPASSDAERNKRRRQRSLAIAALLVGLAILFYVVTIIQIGGNTPAGG